MGGTVLASSALGSTHLTAVKFSVVGAGGFIGSAISRLLASRGYQVRQLPRDFEISQQSEDLGHLIYCAGVTGRKFHMERFNVVEAHVSLPARMLEYCHFESFTYLSTTRLYGSLISGPDFGERFAFDPANISDFYNLSKLMGESMILNSGIDSARVVRISYVFDFSGASTDEVWSWVQSASAGAVVFEHHPKTEKNYVSLDDVVETLWKIAVHGSRRTYNLANDSNTKIETIAQVIEAATGCLVAYKEGEVCRSQSPIDISVATDEFGFQPKPLIECLQLRLKTTR